MMAAIQTVSVIAASTSQGGIGKDGKLPWHLPEDMALFKAVTLHGEGAWEAACSGDEAQRQALKQKMEVATSSRYAVVMGRRTWESIPVKFRPLPGRVNIVLTKAAALPEGDPERSAYPEGVVLASSVNDALARLAKMPQGTVNNEVFVVGGEAAYREALEMPSCTRIYLTRVGKNFETDAHLPAIDTEQFSISRMSRSRSHKEIPYDFVIYDRAATSSSTNGQEGTEDASSPSRMEKPATALRGTDRSTLQHEEYQYLNLIREVMESGVKMEDRTKVGTLSVFGRTMRFNLAQSFPLLTTKRVFWKGVVEELLWFISGDTNAKNLADKGVHIWDANGSREFLDKRGLSNREEGDLGPVYGFQWRHFGAEYVNMHTDYSGKGVDQLAECIRKIKEDPADRRILMSAWNPADLSEMALPPCHMFCQFYVANGELSCLMHQRSCDLGLGVPFNIASYALLTCMMAQVCGLRPGEFVHFMGNTHVYSNHVEPLQEQLLRTPRPFPVLKINPDIKDIDSFKASDFQLVGYNPHATIKMDMAV